MRIGEAELHETAALIDRRSRHGSGAGEVAELHDDLGIGHEFLGDRHRLARIALAVLELIGELAAVDAAGGLDLVEREIEALLPLRAILRVRPRERTADAEQDGIGAVGEGSARERCSCDCGGERALDQGSTIDVAHARLHPLRC
ncbi:hypothetical protein ACVWZ4_003945 [Bradyrhizobium sp. USDA 4472]